MALEICTGLATNVIPCLACKAWEQLRYLRKYKSYVQDFENEQSKLSDTLRSVKQEIDEAKKRNETLVHPRVEGWLRRADGLLQHGTEASKCSGLCTNCCWQVARAKELERLTKEHIPKLIAEVHEFGALACAAGVPGMEFHSQEFMSFESRKAKFEELKKELQDESNCMIGLHGLGGTGKSTMAIEVGKHVQNSNSFDKVIFITVSNLVDENRIRHDIANELELQLEEEKQLSHAQQIWIRIAHAGKVLVILDDVWEELNLKSIGIQHGIHSKGRCRILLTTRSLDVYVSMGCQKKIQLDILPIEDALNLFLFHAPESGKDCPDDLKKLAQEVVNECGGLPLMIVAVAKAFKSWRPCQWQEALTALKNPTPLRYGIANEHKKKIYNSLRFSYDYLKDEEAQVFFLLCSIFPKAYEIPVELLSRITIGLGLFGEGDQYHIARSHARVIQNKLLNSSLLLNASEEYVKMHDVIREMALEEIENEKIQVIMDSKTELKDGVKYSSCIINGFPNCFEGSKLEAFLVWINANGALDVPLTIFGGMKSLKVLLLHSKIDIGRTSALSLPKSIQSLKHIRTVSLTNWELGDISVLVRNLQKLESLELTNCSIIELPTEIGELDKFRVLRLVRCSLEKNYPFEVIARCSQLEELYYVSNDDHMPISATVAQTTSLPKYQIYHIDGSDFSAFDSSQLDTSIKKSFKPAKLQKIFSKETIKSLAARAEILELEGDDETTGWNNLIPSIFSIEDGAMKDLIKLSLKNWFGMNCLIYTEHLQPKSGVTIFSKVTELQLYKVDVREICCGHYPDGFLNKLEKLQLTHCEKLESTLFKGKLELGNLKSVEIEHCSMACLFHPSTAQSLRQLEALKIIFCSKLKCIIREKADDEDPNPRSHGPMFPALKLLMVVWCEELEFILPICFCEDLPLLESVEISMCPKLKYMFGYAEAGGLHQMQKESTLPSVKVLSINAPPISFNIYPECYLPQKSTANTSEGLKERDKGPSRNVSWGLLCCFQPKSKTTDKDEPSTSKTALPDSTTSQEKYVGNKAHGIFTPPLYPCNLREIDITLIPELRSLFSVPVASSMTLLEKLVVYNCSELEHIVREEVNGGGDHINAISIFPNLREVEIMLCDKLECLFPASCSINLVHLESVLVLRASELKYVFGKSCSDDKSRHRNQNIEIHLPAVNKLRPREVQNMVSICTENYYVKAPSLKDVTLDRCPQLPINSFVDLSVEGHKRQGQLSREKVMGMHLCNLKNLCLASLDDMETIYYLQRLEIASAMNSSLETLILMDMNELRNICVGPKDHHLRFQNLFKLEIVGCPQLKFILCASIVRRLPYLRQLEVKNCKELEGIIEDDDGGEEEEEEECCFPNLYSIIVENCERLKCLFSISKSNSLPQLSLLFIANNPKLERVFRARQEMDIKHVLPKLFVICLVALPKLHTICPAIDFQPVICRQVEDCPNTTLTSTYTKFIEDYERWLEKSKRNEGIVDEDYFREQACERLREVLEKTIKRDRPTDRQNNGSSNSMEIAEASLKESLISEEAMKANKVKDSEETQQPEPAPSQHESPHIPSISTPKKPHVATSSTETKSESSQSDFLDNYVTESAQLENDDLMILFQIMEEDAKAELHMPYGSKIADHEDDSEVAKALADLEASLKMGLNELASSEERRVCLEKALNTLSSYCSYDGLKATILSMQQEIQNVLSSFKQAYTTSDIVTKLEQKEKLMTGQRLQRKGAAMSLLSEIHKTENSMGEAQTREAELKDQISKLQAELYNKEKEIEGYEIKLLSLQQQKKKTVSDTIGFIKELEAVKKERSQLENMDSRWSTCLANMKKTSLLLGIHFKQKL